MKEQQGHAHAAFLLGHPDIKLRVSALNSRMANSPGASDSMRNDFPEEIKILLQNQRT